jgi:hypothetical protein
MAECVHIQPEPGLQFVIEKMLSVCLALSYILVAACVHIQPEPGLQFMIDKMLKCLPHSFH